MKTYMALDGLRWSRDSGSANCDMPRSAVFGRSGGGEKNHILEIHSCFHFFFMLFSCVFNIFTACPYGVTLMKYAAMLVV